MVMLSPAGIWSMTMPFLMESMVIFSYPPYWMSSSFMIRAMRMNFPFFTCFQ